MRRLGSTMLVAGFAILAGCGGSSGGGTTYNNPTDPGGGNTTCPATTVCMRASTFQPLSLTVTKGATVTFSNTSTVDHNTVFDATPQTVTNIGLIGYGTMTTRTLSVVGTYNFHCMIHDGMTGSIVAQ